MNDSSVAGSRLLSRFLKMAVMAGVESAVQIHIDRGDNLNARDGNGLTPLMLSAARNKPAICKLLLEGVGVKPLARLISRLRHRQFGILVTTSYLDLQAYQELVADTHPVIVISAADIAQQLKARLGDLPAVQRWLERL